MATPAADVQGLTGNSQIDGLVQGGAWQFGGGPRTLSYALTINDTPAFQGSTEPLGGRWSQYPAIQAAVDRAFDAWEAVANISFVNVAGGGLYFESTADLAVTLTGDDLFFPEDPQVEGDSDIDAASLAFFPDTDFGDLIRDAASAESFTYSNPEGDLFFDNFLSAFSQAGVADGGLGYAYILHEIGHALGLKHPFDDGQNGRPTFAQLGIEAFDTPDYTIMGEGAITDTGSVIAGYAATPMLLDILAIQTLYGANTSHNAGDTVYALQAEDPRSVIWDAGGIDTLDASALDLSSTLTLDLRTGTMMYHTGVLGGPATAIAYNVVIENVIGTALGDIIHGNDANNVIDGGSGEQAELQSDTMYGHGGNDTYNVDSSLDIVNESSGEGIDLVLASATTTLSANVENLQLVGVAAIGGTGNSQNNSLLGNAAANPLRGAGGDDALNGGPEVDTAMYLGSYSQYAFVNYLEILRVVDTQADRDGVDQLIDVEQVHFDGDNSTRAVTGLDQFTPLEYLASYAELYGTLGNDPEAGYQHYVNTGRFEGRTATFDGMRYIASYSDLMDGMGLNPNAGANHYILAGRFEGRVVNFEAMRYIASYGDLIQGLGPNTDAAVVHYISAGRFEGRVPQFNGRTYIASYSDLITSLGDDPDAGIEHYVRTGYAEGRTSTFDALAYIASYPDLMAGLGANPNAGASHYINGGHIEGRTTTFNAAQYLANYPDLQDAYGPNLDGATVHYITVGFPLEHRTDAPL